MIKRNLVELFLVYYSCHLYLSLRGLGILKYSVQLHVLVVKCFLQTLMMQELPHTWK